MFNLEWKDHEISVIFGICDDVNGQDCLAKLWKNERIPEKLDKIKQQKTDI